MEINTMITRTTARLGDSGIGSDHLLLPTVPVSYTHLDVYKRQEWDTVFIVGCSDGFLPIVMAEGEVAIEEERRLFYVGLTRARRDLQ